MSSHVTIVNEIKDFLEYFYGHDSDLMTPRMIYIYGKECIGKTTFVKNTLKQLKSIWAVIDLQNINRLQNTNDALDVACAVYKLITSAVAEQELQQAEFGNSDNNADDQDNELSGGGGRTDWR